VGKSLRGLDSGVETMYVGCVVTVPAPDPAPNTEHRPITYGDYYYVTTAEKDGKILPHRFFFCEVPAMWQHRVNIKGMRTCYPFTI